MAPSAGRLRLPSEIGTTQNRNQIEARMDTSEIIGFIFAVASVLSLIALCVFVFLVARGNSSTLLSIDRSLNWRQKIFLALAAIGFLVCFFSGAEAMLFWMPDDWGQFGDDGEFHPTKASIAGIFALIGGGVLFKHIMDSTRKSVRLRLAEMQISLERRINNAGSREELESLRDEFTEKMNELRSIVPYYLEANRPLVAAELEVEMYRDLLIRTKKLLERQRR